MALTVSLFIYMSEYKASFYYEESGYAKHAHFRDKQNRNGMILRR